MHIDKKEALEQQLGSDFDRLESGVGNTRERSPVDKILDRLTEKPSNDVKATALAHQVRAIQSRNEKHIEYLQRILEN